jgi:hypothetical protein
MNKDLPGYFIEQTNERLVRIEHKLDDVLAFKSEISGRNYVVSALCAVVVSIAIALLSR